MKLLVKVATCTPERLWSHIQIKSPLNSFAYEKQLLQEKATNWLRNIRNSPAVITIYF